MRLTLPLHWLLLTLCLGFGISAWAEVPTLEDLQRSFAELQSQERALQAQEAALRDGNESPNALMKRLSERLSTMTAEEKAPLFQTNRRGLSTLPEGSPLAPLLAELSAAHDRVGAFHEAYDAHAMARIDFLMNRLRYLTQHIVESEGAGWSKSLSSAAGRRRDQMEAAFERYQEKRNTLGSAKDIERRKAFREFMKAHEAFAGVVGRGDRTMAEWMALQWSKIGGPAADLAQKAWAFGPQLPGAAYSYATGKPLLPNLGQGFVSLAGLQGKEFEIQGRERVPAVGGEKTVNLFLLPHANKIYDSAAVAAMELENVGFLFNPSRDVPEKMIPWLQRINEAIIVGQGSGDGPIEELARRFESGQRNVIVFPEGNMGLAMETRPAQASFYRMLLPLLRARGYQIQVIPVSLPNHAQAGTSGGTRGTAVDSPKLPIVFGEPIPAELVSLMYASGRPEMVWDFTRQSWLENGPSELRPVAGMPTLADTVEAMDQAMGVGLHCRSYMERLSGLGRSVRGAP